MFPFFQPQPPPPRQPPPPPPPQSNVEESGELEVDEQQPQISAQPDVQQQPQDAMSTGVADSQQSSALSTGKTVEEQMVKDIPALLLVFLYGSIGGSLLLLLCCRLQSWCCPPDSSYSPILDYYPPASASLSASSPLISPLSLYEYQYQYTAKPPLVSSTATTASMSSHRFTPPLFNHGHGTSSPLAMSLPSERPSYASMHEIQQSAAEDGLG